ncbi:hypothetical protein VQ643_07645 [Pseudomonas sp. F1_0610]|uniref:hypothetical protein n=1 Tax=Pseudomonas sp. F1_0610 TaxID=3114284 RepID=UPI0039C04ABA
MEDTYQIENKSENEFSYSSDYINFINNEFKDIDLEPWWMLCESEKLMNFWFQALKKQYPARHLIPFAKIDYSDDIACFDANDISGDPRVIFIHAFALEGWEYRGEVANFAKWLQRAKEESIAYKKSSLDE